MKTTQRSKGLLNKLKNEKPVISHKREAEDDLIVIRDATNGKEYYLSVVDTFVISKVEYIVMYNYDPDDGNHHKPELVIMRTEFAPKGDQYFYSIKDKDELETAFTVFVRRYFEANGSAPRVNKPTGYAGNNNFSRKVR